MTDIINAITAKPDWLTKINDSNIVNKWISELKKQGADLVIVDLVIKLLRNYKSGEIYDEDSDYKWVLELSTHPEKFSIVNDCKCGCKICQGKENNESYDTESGEEAETPEYLPISECTCTKSKLTKKKKEFLASVIHRNNMLIDPEVKIAFKNSVRSLRKSIAVDYHPGSNEQVVDLVHPSMFCYVNGVSKTKQKVDPNILFQWLPAEFSIINSKVKINSYINNLDPETNADLYKSIATIFAAFVPKFEHVLKVMHATDRIKSCKQLSNCQVIVKLADTILTPDNPEFPDGSWHLEGLSYEKIIATGIYYYEMKNITENYLQFRSTITQQSDIDYDQNCAEFVTKHYGLYDIDTDNCYNAHTSLAYLGKVKTKEDLCLVFPNFMQHRVSNFKLLDPTKTGSRKILAFFLIDPSQRILSTADVKPQQQLISVDAAKTFRELLMFQRKFEIADQNCFFERVWSLCEH